MKNQVRQKAIELARANGLINLSRRELCDAVGIPDGSFLHIMGQNFGTFLEQLKNEIPDLTDRPVYRNRVDPELRKGYILAVAVNLAESSGYLKLTRDGLAEKADVSMGLINHYFGTMKLLRAEVMRHAIEHERLKIIAQGLAIDDPQAVAISPELKAKAAASLGV